MKRLVLFLLAGLTTGFLLMFGFITVIKRTNSPETETQSINKTETKSLEKILLTPTPTLISELSVDASISGKRIFGVGQLCGGIGKIPCPPNLVCQNEEDDVDSSGFCQKP